MVAAWVVIQEIAVFLPDDGYGTLIYF